MFAYFFNFSNMRRNAGRELLYEKTQIVGVGVTYTHWLKLHDRVHE